MLIPAAAASADGLIASSILGYSHIANVHARQNIRNMRNALGARKSQYADMEDEDDINGGPNHLGAWMRYKKINGARLAKALDITPGMVSDLKNSNRALSAKWLRRVAAALGISPGLLLDAAPEHLDADIVEIWSHASNRERRQIISIAKTIVKDGTGG